MFESKKHFLEVMRAEYRARSFGNSFVGEDKIWRALAVGVIDYDGLGAVTSYFKNFEFAGGEGYFPVALQAAAAVECVRRGMGEDKIQLAEFWLQRSACYANKSTEKALVKHHYPRRRNELRGHILGLRLGRVEQLSF